MGHKYYADDSEQRKEYFDKQFLSYSKKVARNNGITVNKFFSNITDFESFKKSLEVAWSEDASLIAYFQGMDDSALLEFYNRPVVQNILNKDIDETVKEIPLRVVQQEKKTREYFRSEIKGTRTFGYRSDVQVKGKPQVRYRDSKGRFVKRLG